MSLHLLARIISEFKFQCIFVFDVIKSGVRDLILFHIGPI